MTGRDVLHFERILERPHDFGDGVIGRDNQMEAVKWILGFTVAAASTILSIPGCEQPTTSTTPSGVLMASDNYLSSRVPGASETRAISVIPETISVVLSMSSKLAPCQAEPKLIVSGGLPSK